MNFTITGRNVNVSDRLHDYIEKKTPRLEKYFHQLMEVRMILFVEKQDHVAEMVLVGDGVQFYGQEKGGDFYSASDLLLDKVEKQLVRFKEKHQGHKGTPLGEMTLVDINNEENLQLIVEEASAKPANEVEAFLEMRLDKRDFFLYRKGAHSVSDSETEKSYALLYRHGESYHIAEVPADKIGKGAVAAGDIIGYDVKVVKDSATNPEIECKKSSSCSVRPMRINDALNELVASEKSFIPFFNSETGTINVLFNRGRNIGVMLPASK
ncbi:MAG TPA: ribosome-associated translation inhibitor RaiA [Spirochaetota bacterium]